MSRLISLALTLAMVACAQHVTPFAPTGSQPMTPNSGAIAAKPGDQSVTAYVAFKNEATGDGYREALFTVEYSYAAHPGWYEEASKCVVPGQEWHTKVVYNPDNKFNRGPQIRFVAKADCEFRLFPDRSQVIFRAIQFEPNAHFKAQFKYIKHEFHNGWTAWWQLCARGGGNDELCGEKIDIPR